MKEHDLIISSLVARWRLRFTPQKTNRRSKLVLLGDRIRDFWLRAARWFAAFRAGFLAAARSGTQSRNLTPGLIRISDPRIRHEAFLAHVKARIAEGKWPPQALVHYASRG